MVFSYLRLQVHISDVPCASYTTIYFYISDNFVISSLLNPLPISHLDLLKFYSSIKTNTIIYAQQVSHDTPQANLINLRKIRVKLYKVVLYSTPFVHIRSYLPWSGRSSFIHLVIYWVLPMPGTEVLPSINLLSDEDTQKFKLCL